ncbi:MAG: YbaK/EbsC family protein [Solirubrobacteraceae bacterium]
MKGYLRDGGVGFEVIAHPRSESAAAEARAAQIPQEQTAKTVVLQTSPGYRFAVIAASARLDLHKAAEALDLRRGELRFASEAEMAADHDYHALKARGLTHTRATLTIARKLARRSYHLLRALGPAALEPPTPDKRSAQAHPSPMRPQRAASSRSDRGTHAPRGGPPKTERPQSLHPNDRSTIKSPAANARGRGPR